MTDLTEYTWYYCKMKDGDIRMLERGLDYFLSGDVPLLNNEVKEVLAQVPSYEEWQSMDRLEKIMLQERARLNKQVIELLEENTKLKELLKECKHNINIRGYTDTHGNLLLPQIEQALGEDK